MQAIEVHPAATAFRVMTDDEVRELAASITEHGLIEPIVLDGDGRLLDGRNRLAACAIAGVEPRFETLNGGHDPAVYVYAKNGPRRNLTAGQKAMAVAILFPETGGRGGRGHTDAAKTSQPLGGFGREFLRLARAILKHSRELADEVRDGRTSLEAAFDRVQAATARDAPEGEPVEGGEPARQPRRPVRRAQLVPATSEPMSAVIRRMITEGDADEGVRKATAKAGGISYRAFQQGRDIVLLNERDDLTPDDRTRVERALALLDDRRVSEAHEIVEPIATRIWGERGQRTSRNAARRVEQFLTALTIVCAGCENGSQLKVPHLTRAQRDEVLTQLRAAGANLRLIIANVMGAN